MRPPVGGSGGNSGGTGGSTGGSGGSGGSGGGGSGGGTPVSASTRVLDCAMYDTVGKMDMFFSMRCGPEGSQCHTSQFSTVWKDFRSPNVWMRMSATNVTPTVCSGSRIIDTRNWANSLMLAKTKTDPPVCPPGSTGMAGLPMPPPMMAPMMQRLNADEIRCLENYLKAIAGVQ